MARRKKNKLKLDIKPDTINQIVGVVLITIGVLVIISFTGKGELLSWVNHWLQTQLGLSLLFLPFVFISAGLIMFRTNWPWSKPNILLGTILTMFGFMGATKSGEIGESTFGNFAHLLSTPGAYTLFIALLIIGVLIITQLSIAEALEGITAMKELRKRDDEDESDDSGDELKKPRGFHLPKLSFGKKSDETSFSINEGYQGSDASEPAGEGVISNVAADANQTSESEDDSADGTLDSARSSSIPSVTQMIWEYPPLTILDNSEGGSADRGDVKNNAQIIENTLDSFGIRAGVKEVNYGPSVTQYALEISRGTKLSRITGLSTDLALALAAPGGQIRIEAPIAGRSLVGVEVPNHSAQYVTLRKMMSEDALKKHPSKLATALGINVAGKPIIMDISELPHILIAGATGSGKSVAINSFICSILFRASPSEVKFILVDPKRVELTGYNDIPHLLTPVIVEPKKVVSALKWATHEMEERYKKLSEIGVKNIASYNELAGYVAMHHIVIVIDELADVMLFAPAEVEESITRIAQMARAVGIHLLLATQRPSVDVITGLIKANIPGRIAFNVSSMTDSRVILDSPGAEKLLGRGDMLYLPPDQAKAQRVQGTYVADKEIQSLIEFIKMQGQQPDYEEDIVSKYKASTIKGGSFDAGGTEEQDDLFDEVAQFVAQSNKGSASSIQRRFSLGYTRAARILDQMEAMGMVGIQEGSKPRDANVTVIMDYLRKKSGGDVGS